MDSRDIPDLRMKWTAEHIMRNLPFLNSQKTNPPMLHPTACPLKKIQQKLVLPHLKTVLPHAAEKQRSGKAQITPNRSHKHCPFVEDINS
jgi:hypothetical protein